MSLLLSLYVLKIYSIVFLGKDASCLIPVNFSSSQAKTKTPSLKRHAEES